LFYGVIAALVLFVLAVVGIYFSYRFVKNKFNTMVQTYTQTNAAPIRRVELPPERLEEIQARVQRFQKALDQPEEQAELSLSAEEINALIAGDPGLKEMRDHLFVRIEDGRMAGDVSVPLEDMGPLKLKGRYLHGQATFRVSLTNQNLWVSMEQVEVNGKTLPSVLQKELAKQNLAQDARQNPDAQEILEKLDSIQVEDDRLILRTRGPP
jgi:hypothetical protein